MNTFPMGSLGKALEFLFLHIQSFQRKKTTTVMVLCQTEYPNVKMLIKNCKAYF